MRVDLCPCIQELSNKNENSMVGLFKARHDAWSGAETDLSRSANSFYGYSPIQLQSDNLPFGFGHG
jgi:hypothetical protein